MHISMPMCMDPNAHAHTFTQKWNVHNYAHTCMDWYSHRNNWLHMYTLTKCTWVHAHLHVLTCTNIHALYTEHCFSHSFTQTPGNKWNLAVVGLMEAQTAIHIYRKHSSPQSRDKPLPTSPCKSHNHVVLPVTSRAVRSRTCSMRAATYMHTVLSTPSQASQQMCQGWSPLLGYFCKQ